jgi:hypothetical protein
MPQRRSDHEKGRNDQQGSYGHCHHEGKRGMRRPEEEREADQEEEHGRLQEAVQGARERGDLPRLECHSARLAQAEGGSRVVNGRPRVVLPESLLEKNTNEDGDQRCEQRKKPELSW